MTPPRAWLALVTALACGGAAAEAQEEGSGPALVHFADGSSLALRAWTLNYEYSTWLRAESVARGTTAKRGANEIWSGKRRLPTAGLAVEVQYEPREREQEVDGETRRVKVSVARGLVLVARDGKRTALKPEPPAVELLYPGVDKERVVQALTLELHGETLTGSARDLCLLTYSALAECSPEPSQQVTKIEFQP
jgi:hypothetical protein